jgi:hypothetical protein
VGIRPPRNYPKSPFRKAGLKTLVPDLSSVEKIYLQSQTSFAIVLDNKWLKKPQIRLIELRSMREGRGVKIPGR